MKRFRTPKSLHRIVLMACLALTVVAAQAQQYDVGDKVEDITFEGRSDGVGLRLSDFAGKIIFLDWFAWW